MALALAEPEVIAPTWRSVPDYAFTAGPEVIELCADIGFEPDANQAEVLNATFAEKPDGTPAAFDIGVVCARQNLKTATLQMMALGWLFVTLEKRIVYSAHEWNPACDEMFIAMKELIARAAWMERKVLRFDEGKGQQKIELRSGARMFFKTRTADTTRALSGDKLLLDEGLKLQPVHMGSGVPTLATRPMAQVVTASSACKSSSQVLRELVERGRSGQELGEPDPSVAYFEWCSQPPAIACDRGERCDHGRRTPGCGCDKPQFIRQANPAYGTRIPVTFFANARRTMPPHEYGREVMGWHDPAPPSDEKEAAFLDLDRWVALDDPVEEHAPEVLRYFAVDVDLDQAHASIGGAGLREDRRLHLEHIDGGRGTEWIVPRCVELDQRHGPAVFGIDGGGPGKHLIELLREAGLNVVVLDSGDVVEAAQSLMAGVNDPQSTKYVHGPQAELEAAVQGARRRTVGERGFAPGRKASSSADITPLVAAMIAGWLCGDLDYDVLDSIL